MPAIDRLTLVAILWMPEIRSWVLSWEFARAVTWSR
jgi:hypothetical protein